MNHEPSTSNILVAFMTAPNREEARLIARTVVEERLAACCNIAGAVESIYQWQGKVEEAEEVLVIIKTTRERFPDLQRRVTELHSYDIPELIAMPITEGLPGYLEWVGEVMNDEL